MAPEVYGGEYGPKADTFSIGVMAVEMLCLRHPFYTPGDDLEDVRTSGTAEGPQLGKWRNIERALNWKIRFRCRRRSSQWICSSRGQADAFAWGLAQKYTRALPRTGSLPHFGA